MQFWLVEVICRYPGGEPYDVKAQEVIRARIEAGELVCLPDGCVAEAVAQFGDELAAQAERSRLIARRRLGARARDLRVIMTAPMGGRA